jgi:FixJ family two-component response regulator
MGGEDLMIKLKQLEYCPPIIFLTSFGTIRIAVNCIKQGAFHFRKKNLSPQMLWDIVQNALQADNLSRSNYLEQKKCFQLIVSQWV